MRRRTLLRALVGLAAALKLPGAKVWAQTVTFPGRREDTLKELAATVLPTGLGRAGTDAVAAGFTEWVRGYRAGAEMTPGYGSPRVRFKGPSPAGVYLTQLEELATGALAEADAGVRRSRLAEALAEAGVSDLTAVPEGRHVAADLMGFWFLGTAAHDLAYEARIGRNECRTLADAGARPRPLTGGPGAGL